jgi:hypothetical protein
VREPTSLPEGLEAALERGAEADDVLRAVVATLAAEPRVAWAGVAFLERGALVLGPACGSADEGRRQSVPILFAGDPVGELRVDGEGDPAVLDRVAELIAPYVLIGWDTGGESWEP